MNIFMYIIVGLMAILGGGSTVAIVGYLFVVLFQKFYRKIRYGASLYD
nr:hypothetical protein [Lachnospiraceae bacterium]